MFCIQCGKESLKNLYLCEEHFLKDKKLINIVEIPISYCKTCDKFYNDRTKGEAKLFVNSSIRSEYTINKLDIELKAMGKRLVGKINAVGIIPPSKNEKKEELKFNIGFKKNMCDDCVKLSGNYHEAVMQVRGDDVEKNYEKILKFSKNYLIAGVEKLKEGYNIRYLYKKDAARIVTFLRKKMTVTETYKLVGEKKGQKLYRNFYLVR